MKGHSSLGDPGNQTSSELIILMPSSMGILDAFLSLYASTLLIRRSLPLRTYYLLPYNLLRRYLSISCSRNCSSRSSVEIFLNAKPFLSLILVIKSIFNVKFLFLNPKRWNSLLNGSYYLKSGLLRTDSLLIRSDFDLFIIQNSA